MPCESIQFYMSGTTDWWSTRFVRKIAAEFGMEIPGSLGRMGRVFGKGAQDFRCVLRSLQLPNLLDS